jgi:NADH:ubiquinone oxidoreductase subunit 2 (subunit N)
VIVILFSTIGLGYYLRIVKTIYFQKKGSYFLWKNILENNSSKEDLSYFSLGFMFFISLFLIFNFTFIINLLDYMFTYLY